MTKNIKREFREFVFINEEKLISAVEKQPIIYDKTLKGHKKPVDRENAWIIIATEIDFPVNECKKRWRSLRDSFLKHFRIYSSGSTDTSNRKKKTWVFYDQLQFLVPYVNNHNRANEEYECESDNSLMPVKLKNDSNTIGLGKLIDDIDMEETTERFEEIEDSEDTNYRNLNENSGGEMLSNNESPIKSVEIQEKLKCDSQNFDSNEQFLLSCAPTLKRLSNRKNSLARLKIQKLLYDIEFDDRKF